MSTTCNTRNLPCVQSVGTVSPLLPAGATCDMSVDDLLRVAFCDSDQEFGMNIEFGELPEGDHPDVVDMVMGRYGESVLAPTAELERVGVDPEVVAHELEMGMNHADFQTLLDAGLLDVDAFNNGPYTRTAHSRRQFHEGMAILADWARAGFHGDHIRRFVA